METIVKCKLCNREFDQDNDSYLIHRSKGYCSQRCYDNDFIKELIQAGIEEKGFKHERVKYNDREMAFYNVWKKDNEVSPGLNYGNGTLQDLFMEPNRSPLRSAECKVYIEPRDRYIAATVIQWLGTNVGMGFLHEVFNSIGMLLITKRDGVQYITPKPNLTVKQIENKIDELLDENYDAEPKDIAWTIAKWILTY